MSPRPIDVYQVGWVCGLPKELVAARATPDEQHGSIPSQDAQDPDDYIHILFMSSSILAQAEGSRIPVSQ